MKIFDPNGSIIGAFVNLTVEARVLQIFRFSMTIISFLVILLTIIGPLFSIKFHIARVNCSHLDVSKGIYESLRNSVSQSNLENEANGQLPVDSSLTNSEITILTQYAQEQVANSPQYYLISLWSHCLGDYNITTKDNGKGDVKYIKHNDKLKCTKSANLGAIFQYRQTLENYGMEGVLAYAFDGSYDDSHYNKVADRLTSTYRIVPVTIILNCIITGGLILFQYVLYNNKGESKDLSHLPQFLLHMVTGVSVINFLSIAIGGGLITTMIIDTKCDVYDSLGTFGINVQMGNLWFLLLWIGFGCSALLMLSWILPIWCSNPPEDEFTAYQRPGDFRNRNISRGTGIYRLKTSKSAKSFSSSSTGDEESSISTDSIRPRDKKLYESSDEELDNSTEFNPEEEEELGYDDVEDEYDNYGNDKLFMNYKDKEASKLRKLGESLSRNSSVRHLNKKMSSNKISRKNTSGSLGTLKEHELTTEQALEVVNQHTYSPLPHRYRMETFETGLHDYKVQPTKNYNPFEDHEQYDLIELKDLTK